MDAGTVSEHDAVEVWLAQLDVAPSRQTALTRSLSPDERERASRFRFDADRRRFIAARGTLRALLGRHLGRDPAGLEFTYGDHGKPSLKCGAGTAPVYFNLSHAADVALYATSRCGPVGVDLEPSRTDFAVEDIVTHFFADGEAAALSRVSPAVRHEAFFRFWTRKEAYCKARGCGLSQDLKGIDVSAAAQSPTAWFHAVVGGNPQSDVCLRDLNVRAGYAAALAIEGRPAPVTIREWTEGYRAGAQYHSEKPC